MFVTDQSHLPKNLTSYDVWKALAVLIMIIDHVGYYLYPEDMAWRAIGRWCVPIWFFLVGYALSRETGPRLWISGAIIVAVTFMLGLPLLPLNILFTILFVRYVLDAFVSNASQSVQDVVMGAGALVLCYIPSAFFLEYGTVAIALALLGVVARARQTRPISLEKQVLLFFGVMFFFITSQWLGFGMSTDMALLMSVGTILTGGCMFATFKGAQVSDSRFWNTPILKSPLQFFGRYTLEIYVLHLIILKTLSCILGVNSCSAFFFQPFPAFL